MNRKINSKREDVPSLNKRNERKKLALLKSRRRRYGYKTEEKGPNIVKKIFSSIAAVILTVMLIGFITGTIVVSVFAIYVKNYIDPVIQDFDNISTGQKLSSKLYYMDYTDRENRVGTPVEIENAALYGSENRIWVSFTEMPKNLYEAFIAIEDERFWTNDGVDWKRTIGATLHFFTGGDNYGGSTITQQLIKNITGDNQVRIQRKLQEIMRALYLNKTKDKTEILEIYLNTIYLSQGCYGVQAAAKTYFGKDVSELNLNECAALASITQAPTKWDPIQNPSNNKYRRDLVLGKMLELGKITYSEWQEAVNEELVLVDYSMGADGELPEDSTPDDEKNYNTWYTDAVIKSVVERLKEEKGYPENLAYNMLYSGGLKIYTVMDPDIQAALDKVYVENSAAFQDNAFPGIIKPESSMVIIHPTTGDVLGIAGGRGKKTGNLLLNYATATTRSPGSSIKPLTVYAPALEEGIINYASVYDDVPVNFDTGKYTRDEENKEEIIYFYPETNQTLKRTTGWPGNLPTVYEGLTNINYAIQVSKNTIAVRVLQDLTCEYSFNFAKNKLKMTSLIDSLRLSNGQVVTDKGLVALALGEMNYGVTNLEITAAYSIFANNGVYNEPRLYTQVLDSEDNVILGDMHESSIVISSQNSTIMTKMLKNVVDYGTASSISLRGRVNVAGKTGTTNADHDRWFIGYTPYLIGGVWFGFAEPDSLSKLNGNPASAVWDEVMTLAHQKYFDECAANGTEIKKFEDSNGVISQIICADSGLLMTDACKADPRGDRSELAYFTTLTVPDKFCDCHVLVEYDNVTKAIACPDCPEENIVKIGLLKIESRNFPKQVYVTDAQYSYREVTEKYFYPKDHNLPFYANLLEEETFAGMTGWGAQFNHTCTAHYKEPVITPDDPEDPVAMLPDNPNVRKEDEEKEE